MRLLILLTLICAVGICGKSIKKSQKDVASLSQEKEAVPKKKQSAIIAIEIIDPNDNSTKLGKGKKRTIESALGYGYNNLFSVQQKPPKYETYKYSQEDIKPFKGTYQHTQSYQPVGQGFEIQKSVQYNLGSTKPVFVPDTKSQGYYQPGTLFSTVDQSGHVGGLSEQVPQNHGGAVVPVIILRVYTNQLTQPGALHANIPQNHPYAGLNSVNLQHLLSGYYQNQQQSQDYAVPTQGYQYTQSTQDYQNAPHYYQTHEDQELQTHENYPDDDHTKVIFHKTATKSSTKPKAISSITLQKPVYRQNTSPQKFKITVPENTFSKVEVQDHTNYNSPQQYQQTQQGHAQQEQQQQVYYYPQDYYQQDQYYQQNQYQDQYQPSQVRYQDAKQYVQVSTYPQEQQYQTDQNYQYQQYQNSEPQYQYVQPQYDSETQYVSNNQYVQPQYQDQKHSQPEEAVSQDYQQHQASTEIGRDLHTKVYNYHAHDSQNTQKTRSTKKRRVSIKPIVVADEDVKKKE